MVAVVGSVRITAWSTVDPVAPVPIDTEQTEIVREAAGHVVATTTAIEKSIATPLADEVVCTEASEDRVIASPTSKDIVAASTGDRVVAGAAADRVVTAQSRDLVASTEAADDIVAGRPSKPVRSLGASDRAIVLAGFDAYLRRDQQRTGEHERRNPEGMSAHGPQSTLVQRDS